MNKRELIFLGLMLALLFAAWLFVLRPRGNDMDNMQMQIQEKQRILDELETSRPRAVKNLKSDIAELQAIVADQQARLPKGEKIEKVFQDLSSLATDNDLRIHQIRTNQTTPDLSDEEEPSEIEQQGFVLELEGKFQGIQAFLERLEKQPRILRVDEIRIQRVSKESGDATLNANLRLRVFNRKGAETS
jgi:Tfp pilus assembly protein PilO